MLKELLIKNFTSFKNESLFSMEADYDRVSEHSNHIVEIADNRLLKTASCYGPNGGGKSNLLRVLSLIKALQKGSTLLFPDYEFACVYSGSKEIEITVFFVDEEFEIGYKFNIIAERKYDETEGIDEQAFKRSPITTFIFNINYESVTFRKAGTQEFTSLFERFSDGRITGEFFETILINLSVKLAKNKTVVSYIYENFANNDGDLPLQFDIIRRLMGQINSIRRLEILRGAYTPEYFNFVESNRAQIVKLLSKVDIKVHSIKVKKENPTPVFFVREVLQNGKKTYIELPLKMESSGTAKIFDLFVNILMFLDKGTIFYCNDINAYLHPKLTRALVELFQQNQNHAQLIFNSHDIINMDNELFRRDEIWFVFRDENYSSTLVPLSNIVNYKGEQVRKDAKFNKQYLEGRFGADPFIRKGLDWNE